MFSLTDEQVAFIENDIKIRGITSPDLCIDLLDHICCLIENKLDDYRNFDTVYLETIAMFGEKGMKEIQDETNRLLTFKNYYIMNSTMKISGYVSSLMILAGAFFKLSHWPGANAMLVLGVFTLTVLFLPLLFILRFKSSAENNRSVVLSIIGFVASLFICAGILFKILHWPYAQMLTLTGAALLLFGYLPIYFISIYKNAVNKMNATATVVLMIAGVGIAVINSFGGLPRTTSDSFWRGVTECDELLVYLKKENQNNYEVKLAAVADTSQTAQNVALLQSKTNELISYIDEMKNYLISVTTDTTLFDPSLSKLDNLRTAGGSDIIREKVLENGSEKFSVINLKSKIASYREAIQALSKDVDLTFINTADPNVYGEKVAWEDSNFDHLPIPLVIFNLTRIEVGIKVTESVLMNRMM